MSKAGSDSRDIASLGLDRPNPYIPYRAVREAAAFLKRTMSSKQRLCLLYGPPASGKKTLVQRFAQQLPRDDFKAIIDGCGLDAERLLQCLATDFRLAIEHLSPSEFLNRVKVFALREASTQRPPVLILYNVSSMKPSAVHVVCELAALSVQDRPAMRFLFVSDNDLARVLNTPGLAALRIRESSAHELRGMTRAETAYYIDAKLRDAGIVRPQSLVSGGDTDQIFDATNGRPGLVDRALVDRLSSTAEQGRVRQGTTGDESGATPAPEPDRQPLKPVNDSAGGDRRDTTPRLIITNNGNTMGSIPVKKRRMIIGRSKYSDVNIDSSFVSRHHAMLVRDNGHFILMDLNSRNGTYVNSERVFVHALRHDDVLTLGNYGIKLFDPANRMRPPVDTSLSEDTGKMKTLADQRREKAAAHARTMTSRRNA